VRLINIKDSDAIAAVTCVPFSEESEDEDAENGTIVEGEENNNEGESNNNAENTDNVDNNENNE